MKGKEAKSSDGQEVKLTQQRDAVYLTYGGGRIRMAASAIKVVRVFDRNQMVTKEGEEPKGGEPEWMTTIGMKTGNTTIPGDHFDRIDLLLAKASAWRP